MSVPAETKVNMTRQSIKLPIKTVNSGAVRDRLSGNALEYILPARYLRRDEAGQVIETPEAMFRRVAENVAHPDTRYGYSKKTSSREFFDMMTALLFMPNTPTLMNAGTGLQQLAACFVLTPEDSLDSICQTAQRAAKIFQSGGGVGYAFSRLRPKGAQVHSTQGKASGPVSFMKIYDQLCHVVWQGGKRKGAQMAVLRVDHPDVGRFIVSKRKEGALANFNISVAITDEFIDAVKRDKAFTFRDPSTHRPFRVLESTAFFYNDQYADASCEVVEENFWRDHAKEMQGVDSYYGRTNLKAGQVMSLPAGFTWNMTIDCAWKNGEPGLFMVDQCNREHSFDTHIHKNHSIEATNPCGEQPLENFEACNLGHINLSLMLRHNAPSWVEFTERSNDIADDTVSRYVDAALNWPRLSHVIHTGIRFLDNAVTMSRFPLEEIDWKVRKLRKIGLGIMGYAQMLAQMGIVYGSKESVAIAAVLMKYINRQSKIASHRLAKERGVFENWEESKYARPAQYPDWFRRHTGLDPEEWTEGFPLRNHSTTTVAPTGTTSMIANTSAGCEPLFNVIHFKRVSKDVCSKGLLTEFDDYFMTVLEENDLDVENIRSEALGLMRAGDFVRADNLSIPHPVSNIFTTAVEIAPRADVLMQAVFQKHVDSAISKTINFSPGATRREIDNAFRLALNLNCKGITGYRVDSRKQQVLGTHKDRKSWDEECHCGKA